MKQKLGRLESQFFAYAQMLGLLVVLIGANIPAVLIDDAAEGACQARLGAFSSGDCVLASRRRRGGLD